MSAYLKDKCQNQILAWNFLFFLMFGIVRKLNIMKLKLLPIKRMTSQVFEVKVAWREISHSLRENTWKMKICVGLQFNAWDYNIIFRIFLPIKRMTQEIFEVKVAWRDILTINGSPGSKHLWKGNLLKSILISKYEYNPHMNKET